MLLQPINDATLISGNPLSDNMVHVPPLDPWVDAMGYRGLPDSGRRGVRTHFGRTGWLKARRAFGLSICLLASGCFGPDHPDFARFEYLYMNGAFVAPYKTFPVGRERESWQCFDQKSGKAYDCTFVRGGFEHFQYVFRQRQ